MQHWKQHKVKCTDIKKIDDNWKEERSKTLPDGSALDTKEGPCAICLEETITNPVVLPCGHAFCFACVGSYQQTSESDEASCPYIVEGRFQMCAGQSYRERVELYLHRASASSKGSELAFWLRWIHLTNLPMLRPRMLRLRIVKVYIF